VKPALGYRIDFVGHFGVLSGDTRYSENLIRFSEGADVLIHEGIDPEALRLGNPSASPARMQSVIAHHTTPEQAWTVFTRAKPKLAVVFAYSDPGTLQISSVSREKCIPVLWKAAKI
jgi:ribonuclease Z